MPNTKRGVESMEENFPRRFQIIGQRRAMVFCIIIIIIASYPHSRQAHVQMHVSEATPTTHGSATNRKSANARDGL